MRAVVVVTVAMKCVVKKPDRIVCDVKPRVRLNVLVRFVL